MGNNENKIATGTLVQYLNIDSELVYGVVTGFIRYFHDFRGPAVKVTWFDDLSTTTELLSVFDSQDSDECYIEVVSEAR